MKYQYEGSILVKNNLACGYHATTHMVVPSARIRKDVVEHNFFEDFKVSSEKGIMERVGKLCKTFEARVKALGTRLVTMSPIPDTHIVNVERSE